MKIAIYQLIDSDETDKLVFRDYTYVSKHVDLKNDFFNYYTQIYEYEDTFETNKEEHILEEIFTKFNISRPNDFKGHSLSVSDVIGLDDQLYFCDDIGFVLIK